MLLWEILIILPKTFRSENNFLTPSLAQTNQLSMYMTFTQKSRLPNCKIYLSAWPLAAKMDLLKKAPPEQLVLPTQPLTQTLVVSKVALKSKEITTSTSLPETQLVSQCDPKLLEVPLLHSSFCKIINRADLMRNKQRHRTELSLWVLIEPQ